MKLPAGYENFD